MKLFRQRKTGRTWGYFMQIIQQEAIVVQTMILILSFVTTASVLQIRGYEVPVWLLVVFGVAIIVVGGIGVYVLGMPSYFGAFNEQFYKHNNPMRRDIEHLQRNQEKIMKHLGIEVEHEDKALRNKHASRKNTRR